jgi:flagellar basal-body rod modification protein FlgD
MTDVISFVQQTNTGGSTTATSTTQLTENFDTFLTLLTAQVQNQDPLSPTDATQFTEQLVQFSGVEQQIQSNENLETLITANTTSTNASLANYLGQEVEVNTANAGYHGQDIRWAYNLEDTADTARISVLDQNGRTVFTTEANTDASQTHEFTWDGTQSNGDPAPQDSVYSLLVTAVNSEGNAVNSSVRLRAQVTGVDMSYDSPALTTNAGIFSYSDLLRVHNGTSNGSDTNSVS